MKRFVSLNFKVFILALVIMIIPSTIVGTLLYQKSIDTVKQKQKILVKNAFKNISDSLEINMRNARDMSLFIISDDEIRIALKSEDMGHKELIERQNIIMSSLIFFTGQSSYIESVSIQGNNGMDIELGQNNRLITEEDVDAAHKKRGGFVWRWEETGLQTPAKLYLLREINDIEEPSRDLGILQIGISSDVLKEQFADFINMYPGYISIWSNEGTEIYALGDQGVLNEKTELTIEENISTEIMREVGDEALDSLSYFYRIPDSDWLLISSMRFSTLYAENNTIRALLINGVLISFMLCLLVTYIFSRGIIKPLKQLTEKIGQITDENYKIRLDFDSNDEIGVLSRSFNNMAKRLDELVNEVFRGKMLQKDAQFKALQAQINPHFLYNNLDTAYWMSRLEKAEKTGKIILALSALYRSAASTEGKMVPVSTELQYAKEYILIQQLRFDTMIKFEIDVGETVLNETTLRFVLQPLIENSIEHGIQPTGMPGVIHIAIYEKDGGLYFEIEDSGQGSLKDELTLLLETRDEEGKRGMAIRNIHQRIKLQFGAEYGLKFDESDLGGIKVIVKQPAISFEKTIGTE